MLVTEELMLARKIRCFVVRIPEDDTAAPPRAAWREALPWADPYILGLIRKLQEEVRQERATRFMSAREADDEANQRDCEVELDGLTVAPDPAAQRDLLGHLPATCAAAEGSPPIHIVKAEPAAEDEGEWNPRLNRPVRLPR
jgi:hypothetical protein